MIGFLRGEVFEIKENKALVLVGGVGYSVSLPLREARNLQLGQILDFYIHTHVREDALDLYGFRTADEKEMFLTLLQANGVGPKAALNLLSHLEPSLLIGSILNSELSILTGVPGVGKKTAERIVIDLADTIRKKIDLGQLTIASHSSAFPQQAGHSKSLGTNNGEDTGKKTSLAVSIRIFQEAKEALMSLGFKEGDAARMLDRAKSRAEAIDSGGGPKVETLVKFALREVNN